MKEYQIKYASAYGIKWGNSMEIHHINGNHEDDRLSNLILLPKHLHSNLHAAIRNYRTSVALSGALDDFATALCSQILNGCNSGLPDDTIQLFDTLDECRQWGLLKANNYCDVLGRKIETIKPNTTIYG